MTTETSIYGYVKQGLALSAEKPAMWYFGRSINYRELFEKIDNVADNLYALGVREGTVVTIHLPNCPQAVMAIYAVAKLGGICNMVHALTPEKTLLEMIRSTGSELLITYIPGIRFEKKLEVDISYHMSTVIRTLYRIKNKRTGATFEKCETDICASARFPSGESLKDKCAVILHSSGSTGHSKAILLSHSALNNCTENTADFFEKKDMADQVCLGVLPLFHGFGLAADLQRNLRFGSTLVLMAKWNARSAVKLIKKYGVTLICGVPAMFHSLINERAFRGKRISQLTYCYTGGDNVGSGLIDRYKELFPGKRIIYPGYGLTEATTMNCVNVYDHYKPGTIGYPVRNTTIAVVTDDGSIAYTGRGEMIISSPTLMMGYLNDPDATAKTLFEAEGKRWTRTGDQVEIGEDGFVTFIDRLKNIIIHNGYNIYPAEVEDAIRKVPGVREACVVGVFQEATRTQNVRAAVIPDVNTDRDELRRAIGRGCLSDLPRYAIPKEIVFMDVFPHNSMGKIDRKELAKN